MKPMRFALLAGLLGGGLASSQAPPKFFELEIPEFQGRVFDSDIVEVPVGNLSRLVIHVLSPMADNVGYGKIYPKLNGDAASIICQYRSTARGKALFMDLKMRPDLRLLPGSNVLEITAVNQRGRKYYKNWTLRTREQSRNEWFAYDFTLSANEENQAPPDLSVSAPEFPVLLEKNEAKKRVRVRGVVSAVYPLASIHVNDVNWTGPLASDTLFDLDVPVTAKDQSIRIEAADQKGNRTRVTIPVSTAVTARSARKLTGDRYALIVGISRYEAKSGGPPNLPAASADAESFAAMLTTHAGFTPDHVLLLRDEKATSAQVRNAFRNFVALAKPDDLLIVYFAGHGLHDPNSPDKIYLACYETQMGQLAGTALELGDLESLLSANVRSRNALLLFDVGRETGADWRIAGSNLVNSYLLRLFSKQQGRTVMVSSGVNETSHERQTGGRYEGLFTSWMIEALQGKADWNHDGLVTVAELVRFVAEKVHEETNGAQTPRYQIADLTLPVAANQ